MSKSPDANYPPWLSDAIRSRVRLAIARTWIAEEDREDLVHDVWLFLLQEGETPASVAAKSPAELNARLLTLANRAAARAARAHRRRPPQAETLAGVHDGSADPARAAEIRDTLDGIAQSLLDQSMESRLLVGRRLARNPRLDPEIVRAFAEKTGLTERDLHTGTKAMSPKNRQKLHRLMRGLRAVVTCLTAMIAAEASIARANEHTDRYLPAPAASSSACDRDHWN